MPYYGRYLCRIEIGNEAHRLEMHAQIKRPTLNYDFNPYTPALMAVAAVIFIIALLFLVKYSAVCIAIQQRREKKMPPMDKEAMRIREVVQTDFGLQGKNFKMIYANDKRRQCLFSDIFKKEKKCIKINDQINDRFRKIPLIIATHIYILHYFISFSYFSISSIFDKFFDIVFDN